MSHAVLLPSVAVAAAVLCGMTSGQTHGGDTAAEWNRLALDAVMSAADPEQEPAAELRAMTVVHVAIHDAVNSITRRYRTYLPTGAAPRGASPEAAAIGAAHRTLSQLYPARSDAFDSARLRSLAAHGLSESDPGIRFGESAATAVLARRSRDGHDTVPAPHAASRGGAPGVWKPAGVPAAVPARVGKTTTWVLRSAAQFRPGRPPALDGSTYARDYNELKAIGSLASPTRTREQTTLGQFWLAAPSAIWSNVARQALLGRRFDLSASARTLALMYLAASDASIACWDAKYTYLFWEPRTAIRNGEADGNEATIGDPAWQPLAEARHHPEYPSEHAANSAAMAAILSTIFGEKPGIRLVATSPTKPGVRRTWSTFKEGVDEVIAAPVYAGFQFRTSSEAGARLGYQVAHFVLANALQPVP